MRVIEEAIVAIMIVNFSMLSVEAQKVPTSGSMGSLRSRGYLLGITDALIQQFAAMTPTQEETISALASAFAVTYGPCDWNWALDTVDALQAGNQDVLDGAKLGRRDVAAVHSGAPFATPTGFWLLNNGDEEAVRYNLASLET